MEEGKKKSRVKVVLMVFYRWLRGLKGVFDQ